MLNYMAVTLLIVLITGLFIVLCIAVIKWADLEAANKRMQQLRETLEGIEQQNKMLGETLSSFEDMKTQQDIIAIWLRENRKAEIAMGLHNGRGLGEIVVGYLSGEVPVITPTALGGQQ